MVFGSIEAGSRESEAVWSRCAPANALTVTAPTLQPQNLPMLIDPASEQLLDNLAVQYRLRDNAFNVAWLDSSIPDPLPSQRITLK